MVQAADRPMSLQVMGKVPTISINKTDGCHVYLSKDSVSCEVISAKSSEMNILVPDKDGEFVSNLQPVPVQHSILKTGVRRITSEQSVSHLENPTADGWLCLDPFRFGSGFSRDRNC